MGSKKGHISEDGKRRIAEAARARMLDPGQRQKVAVAAHERWADPEYRDRLAPSMSAGQAARWTDPAKRAAQSKKLKGKKQRRRGPLGIG